MLESNTRQRGIVSFKFINKLKHWNIKECVPINVKIWYQCFCRFELKKNAIRYNWANRNHSSEIMLNFFVIKVICTNEWFIFGQKNSPHKVHVIVLN
jgi:hypothetical protein